ncbi:MAG: tRNA-dihydrouridine synthase family protein [Planctomycetes bacterium]|nr:tRNA-dihydrouridine synthase family protein [Planctomycetota bacterium]
MDVRPIDLGRGVRFDPPFVLAPMEGVTHRVFRDLLLDAGGPGAAWTEFLRVSQVPLRTAAIRRELGPPRADVPVGVQLMGTDPGVVAETARNAVTAGAPMIDLNFGCPAPVVFNKCAGSAMLDHPERLRALVAAVVAAVDVPVTAKVRLGVRDASRFEEVVRAVDEAGAAALTVHARTRADQYAHPARWEHLARAREWTRRPLIGNGDVLGWDDAARMMRECKVDGVMVGRGALRDPWVLARLRARARGAPEPEVGPAQVLGFHARYRDDMLRGGASERGLLGQLKQLYRRLEVGLPIDAAARAGLLRAATLVELEARVEALARACDESAAPGLTPPASA